MTSPPTQPSPMKPSSLGWTLERYIVRDYLLLTVITLVSLLAFFSIFYLADYARIVSERQREFTLALKMTALNLPLLASEVGPMTVLLSLFILGTGLSRRGELVAIYSAGIGPARVYGPILLASVFLAGGLFMSSDRLAPDMFARLDHILLDELGRLNVNESYFHRPRHWYRAGGQMIRLSEVDSIAKSYDGVLILNIADGHVQQKLNADKVTVLGNQFVASGVTIETFAPDHLDVAQLAEKKLALPENFNAFLDLSSRPQKMFLGDLERVFKLRRRQGYNPRLYELEFYARIIAPFNLLALIAAALPFAFRPDVKRTILSSGAECLSMIVIAFFLNLLFKALGMAQTVSAQIGAMGPGLCLLGFAVYRLAHTRLPSGRWRQWFASWQ